MHSFREWYLLRLRRNRYRKGIFLLHRAWFRLKYKLAYYTWPGRKECLLSNQLRDYLSRKRSEKMRLVDVPPKNNLVEVVSFVAKRRPTFAQRATNLHIVSSKAELDSVEYYKTLCTTILQMWQSVTLIDIETRKKALKVRNALQFRTLHQCMMKWVLTTPKTSYRRIVWMVKPEHRAHDAYAHRKQLMKEYRMNFGYNGLSNIGDVEHRILVGKTTIP